MRVVFRTEGNEKQGMGDVWGSIALADEFSKSSDEIIFVLSEGEKAIELLEGRGYQTCIAESVEEELVLLRRFQPHVVIVIKLNNEPQYIKALKALTQHLVTIDDAGDGSRYADTRINVLYHTYGAETDPKYITLRSEFRGLHERGKRVRREVQELLIMQGGSDTYGFTPSIVHGLEGLSIRPRCNLILGPEFRHEKELAASLATSSLDFTVLNNPHNLGELMWRADLAVTAGGLAMFELASVGTPSIVVCGERFEEETASGLEQSGVVVNLGFGAAINYDDVSRKINDLALDWSKRKRMSVRGRKLVDGKGCERIVGMVRQRLCVDQAS